MLASEIEKLPYRPNVGVALVNRVGQFWVGQRFDAMQLGDGATAWQMPQGGIDEGEDARSAALRELEEETSVSPHLVEIISEFPGWLTYDLPHDVVPKIWKGRYRGQKQKWFLLRFNGADSDVKIDTKHPEFCQWRWVSADEIMDRIVPFKRDIYRALLDEFCPKI